VEKYRISFIGAGNVAGSLCRQLYLSGCTINRIVSRTEKKGSSLARSCNAEWSNDFVFEEKDDIIITAVPDDSLRDVLKKVSCSDRTVVAHTSGSTGIDIFPPNLKRNGVFYPLQTFTSERNIQFRDLPIFLEASDSMSASVLNNLGDLLEGRIFYTDSERRRLLHIAAVFVCNFVNHMFTSGKQITEKADLPFEVLKPLINETVLKALENGPENSQTGPAYRSDKITLKKHIDLLSFSPELQVIYKDVTESIMKLYKSKSL
jgi:predicted short-subunit dehydrogenase-like oxidoreductase (DUF2520 family)